MKVGAFGLLTLVVTLLFPPFGLILGTVGLLAHPKDWKLLIFSIALSIGIFAYTYEPYNETDLIRYYQFFDEINNMSFTKAITSGRYGQTGLLSFCTTAWLISKSGDYNLLPFFTTFSVYYIALYFIWKITSDGKMNKRQSVLLTLIILIGLPFYNIVNNVRNVFALAIFMYAFFRESYLKKKNAWTYFLYIYSVLFHTSALVFLLIRLVYSVVRRHVVIAITILFSTSALLTLLYPYIANYRAKNIVTVLIRTFVVKGYSYFADTDSEWAMIAQSSGSMMLTKVLNIMICILLCIIFFWIYRNKIFRANKVSFVGKGEEQVFDFALMTCLMGTVAIVLSPLLTASYWRFSTTMLLSCGPMYCYWNESRNKYKQIATLCLAVLCFMCLLLWMRRMQFDNIDQLLLKPFVSSPILILFNMSFPHY